MLSEDTTFYIQFTLSDAMANTEHLYMRCSQPQSLAAVSSPMPTLAAVGVPVEHEAVPALAVVAAAGVDAPVLAAAVVHQTLVHV